MSKRVAIVGSRDYPDLEAVADFVRSLPPGTTVVSGGARGVDARAEETAAEIGLHLTIHLANWKKHGRAAGFLRNKLIVGDADRIVAFWYGESPGTANTIRLARDAGKPVEIRKPAKAGT